MNIPEIYTYRSVPGYFMNGSCAHCDWTRLTYPQAIIWWCDDCHVLFRQEPRR